MKKLLFLLTLSLLASPATAQAPAAKTPVADALRLYLNQFCRNLVAAVDDFAVSKYSYAASSPQQTVATVIEHLAGSNNFLCASVAGIPAPTTTQITPATAPPDTLKARLRKSFEFCQTTLAKLDDSNLSDSVPFFGGKRTRAAVILALPYDWADHYSQLANYLRLNAISPPNARARAVPVQ
jgi:hypothetical protein